MDELIEKIIQFRDERDWKQFHDPKDLALSISLESSELLELFQWKNSKQAIEQQYSDMQDEIADIFIYTLTLAHDLQIDVKDAILQKIDKNAKKYPISSSKGSSQKSTRK
ncbi:MazG-like family protein [Paenibacillus sp. FSL H8-0259]|uniref:MazG-like family protein n=1 Tax=Paenibacillus sp. FSL H8-0259 TaxID=1920423 RepID=UPI00096E02CC|nr:MazG-like family protein [Paenibacillus sp. FSL H8-0259]OMF22032.1 nucleotide pyrophosphohydrolase [Paenibacillus sp. FSL H8-0259]